MKDVVIAVISLLIGLVVGLFFGVTAAVQVFNTAVPDPVPTMQNTHTAAPTPTDTPAATRTVTPTATPSMTPAATPTQQINGIPQYTPIDVVNMRACAGTECSVVGLLYPGELVEILGVYDNGWWAVCLVNLSGGECLRSVWVAGWLMKEVPPDDT